MSENNVQEVVGRCNFCGTQQAKTLHHYPAGFYGHQAYVTYPWDGKQMVDLTIVQCPKCELIYQDPRFKPEFLGLLYTDSVDKNIDLEKAVRNHKFAPLIDLIKQNCTFQKDILPISVDIGTRYGLLPEVLRRNGFNSYGIEYNPLCVEAAAISGFKNVFQGTIDNLDDVMSRAGVSHINMVTMTDVIEHLLDPLGDLIKLSAYQSAGDYMVIQTVDIGSVGYKIFGSWWYHIHGQHTYYFDEKSMRMYFEKIGYTVDAVLKVKRLNNLTLLPSVWKKFRQHKKQRLLLNAGSELPNKVWFAETRPTLFDIFTVVARKK
jgi:hypothetical protein